MPSLSQARDNGGELRERGDHIKGKVIVEEKGKETQNGRNKSEKLEAWLGGRE